MHLCTHTVTGKPAVRGKNPVLCVPFFIVIYKDGDSQHTEKQSLRKTSVKHKTLHASLKLPGLRLGIKDIDKYIFGHSSKQNILLSVL